MSIARTYTSCFTHMPRNFFRHSIVTPRPLPSMGLSLELTLIVSQQVDNRVHSPAYGA